jgi:hypothetical protein
MADPTYNCLSVSGRYLKKVSIKLGFTIAPDLKCALTRTGASFMANSFIERHRETLQCCWPGSWCLLTLSWPAGYIFPTYKESFQVRWGNSIPLFLHAAVYLEVYLFRWTSQNAMCAMLQSSIAHSIICTRLFRGKMHWSPRNALL